MPGTPRTRTNIGATIQALPSHLLLRLSLASGTDVSHPQFSPVHISHQLAGTSSLPVSMGQCLSISTATTSVQATTLAPRRASLGPCFSVARVVSLNSESDHVIPLL